MSGVKKGAGAAVLEAAQVGNDPIRSQAINQIRAYTPKGKRIANSHLHMGSQRSSAERAQKKMTGIYNRHPNKQHVHVLHGKFNRKPRNAVKSYLKTYS
jgi:carbonic anhydrase/acetyltransferase-like protein (isoleucine patch superfamily)